MREWLKANGGPLAISVVGLGLLSLSVIAGLILIAIGLTGFVLTRDAVKKRIPYKVVKRNPDFSDAAMRLLISRRQNHENRRLLVRRIDSKIRKGRELLNEAYRTTREWPEPAQSSAFFTSTLRGRIDKWTEETEKLLETAPDEAADAFHEAAMHLPEEDSHPLRESEYCYELMQERVTALERISDGLTLKT